MDKVQTIREVLGLASGRVAKLCGSCLYADIDAYIGRWVAWLESQADDVRFSTWHDAYFAFTGQ